MIKTNTVLELIKEQIKDNLYHGASLAIYENGEWHEHYLGTIDGNEKVKAGLVYDLASVSKVVGVRTLLAKLVYQGTIDIDKPLRYYYPTFHHQTLTVRQLATHSSGIDPFIPNRDQLNATQLKDAINHIKVLEDKSFKYTDINFLLLGFMLEEVLGDSLDKLFKRYIFTPFQMKETSFGPRVEAVPTVAGINDGIVHDPKAKVLGKHTGSAGLFSTIDDLQRFSIHYLKDDFAKPLWNNYSLSKSRSLAWDIDKDWINHTGYTGPFIALNYQKQAAAIFLTNRTFSYDDRPLWIKKRRHVQEAITSYFE